MRHPNEIITSRIPRSELAGLLNTMTPLEQQRVTAEITVPVVDPGLFSTSLADGETYESFEDLETALSETAEMMAPRAASGATTSAIDVVVRFAPPAPPGVTAPARRPLPSWVIVAASTAMSLVLGGICMLAA